MAPCFISLLALARDERADDDDLADLVAVGDRLAGADRAVGAEDQEALEIRDCACIWSTAVL